MGEGELGVVSLRASIPSMRVKRLDNLRFSDHPECAAALTKPLLTGLHRTSLEACRYKGKELLSKKSVQKMWAALLHRSNDGAALRESRDVPGAHRWVSEGTRMLPGRQYINLLKLRVIAQPTLERTSRGRGVDISCGLDAVHQRAWAMVCSAVIGGTVTA